MNGFLQIGGFLCVLAIFTVAAQKPKNIRNVDFKNFTYEWDEPISRDARGDVQPWYWMEKSPNTTFRMRNGQADFTRSDDGEVIQTYISMYGVSYGQLEGDSSEDAAVHLNYSTGGTANWDYLYVYKVDHERAKLLARLESGERAYGGLVHVAIENRLLVLDFADPERSEGDCCSKGYIRVHYAWRHGHFEETGPWERGDLR